MKACDEMEPHALKCRRVSYEKPTIRLRFSKFDQNGPSFLYGEYSTAPISPRSVLGPDND